MDIHEKLARINPSQYAKRDADLIRGWKDRLPQLVAQADWLQHPVTQDLKAEVAARLQAIRNELADNDTLAPEQQLELRGQKKAMQFLMDMLSRDPQGEMQVIESAVDLEL